MSIFMKITGITGESSDSNHKGWMDVDSLQWGVNRLITSSTSTANDRESANAVISDLTFTRGMDSSTPSIFIDACCGNGKDVEIHLTKTGSGSGADVFMQYTLKNALISEYHVSGDSQSTERPTENVTLSFIDVEVKYIPHDEDGKALSAIAVGFDTATNTKR